MGTARILCSESDRVIGGRILDRHESGEVTILWAGNLRRGRVLTPPEIRQIEAGRPISEIRGRWLEKE